MDTGPGHVHTCHCGHQARAPLPASSILNIYAPIHPVSIYLYICLCCLAAGHIVLTVFVARRHVCEAAAQPEQFYTTIYVKNCQWAK